MTFSWPAPRSRVGSPYYLKIENSLARLSENTTPPLHTLNWKNLD
jgi:hypothetical protein